jgi:cytochrome c556
MEKVTATPGARKAEAKSSPCKISNQVVAQNKSTNLDIPYMIRAVLVVAGIVLLGAVTVPSAARADDQDTIDYRRHIMKTMGEQAAAISEILQQKVAPDGFAVHVRILAITAATAKKAFEPKIKGGEAKAEVWDNWADFAKRLDDLTAATADLAKTAEEGGVATTAPKIQAALTCKGCHDHYREQKK